MTLVVYTSIYGSYDDLKPHPDHPAVTDWVCFTDNPTIDAGDWTVVVEPARHPHPRMAAKWRKCHPPEALASIWVDGSVLFNAAWVDECLRALEHADVGMFRHPERTSIVDEAAVSLMMSKYHGLPVMEQARHYIKSWGWNDHQLWAGGAFARLHTPQVLQFGAAWYSECEHWTYQDQISLPPLLARYGIHPEPFGHSLWRNPWFQVHRHRSDL